MSDIVVKNAVVDSVRIGFESHGILTVQITLRYNESTLQGFGNYFLDVKNGASMAVFLRRVLEVFEVDDVSKLRGAPCRIKIGESIKEIGHFHKEKWFCPNKELT